MESPSLPQPVTSEQCLSCEICCRFPEKDSPLAPYFTPEEIKDAIRGGIPSESFQEKSGGRIELIPNPAGEGYICPAFKPSENSCRIYPDRPFDCVLYPFSLMRDEQNKNILIGYDRKCPVISDRIFGEGIYQTAQKVMDRLRAEEYLSKILTHPELVGEFQADVMVLGTLGGSHSAVPRSSPETLGLTSLSENDRVLFESALEKSETNNLLSAYSWPPLWIWKDHLDYFWRISHGLFCLFAKSPDGFFMPILPAGGPFSETVIRKCFEIMDSLNPDPAVSRIENVGEDRVDRFKNQGFKIIETEQEYLYETGAIVDLAGDRFKSQRWAENRFQREHKNALVRFEGFRTDDLNECLELHKKWTEQKEPADSHSEARLMLEDSYSAHKRALENADKLGLRARVVRIDGRISGYTAGFPFREGIFCVLLEVADRALPGLAVFLFREFCREVKAFPRIHAMGDSGLEPLRKAKLSYHPGGIFLTYIVKNQ